MCESVEVEVAQGHSLWCHGLTRTGNREEATAPPSRPHRANKNAHNVHDLRKRDAKEQVSAAGVWGTESSVTKPSGV